MEPFDPLDLQHIGVTLAVEMLEQSLHPLPPSKFTGAGVYAIYYSGQHPDYSAIVNRDGGTGGLRYPIYIGSALREKAKSGFNPKPTSQARMWERLIHHSKSIQDVIDSGMDGHLLAEDFHCRYLVLSDAYVILAESVLIATFRPAWNGMGFGSKVVGVERTSQRPSQWDSLHPGRGGRPTGNPEQRRRALERVSASVEQLSSEHQDPRMSKMIEKIRRFI